MAQTNALHLRPWVLSTGGVTADAQITTDTATASPRLDSTHPTSALRSRPTPEPSSSGQAALEHFGAHPEPLVPSGVLVCTRPLTLGGLRVPIVRHLWLKTDKHEVGFGPATGEIPTVNGHIDPPGTPVALIDHKGTSALGDVTTVPIEQTHLFKHLVGGPVSAQKVDSQIEAELGLPHGRYLWPPTNNCIVQTIQLLRAARELPSTELALTPPLSPPPRAAGNFTDSARVTARQPPPPLDPGALFSTNFWD